MNSPLERLNVLAMDCQATGASPQKGHLLEIGWTVVAPDRIERAGRAQIESHLLRLPDETPIPPAVLRVTGIGPEMLAEAIRPEHLWQRLQACAQRTAALDGMVSCPTVIHFARYETPFLKQLNARFGGPDRFPLQVVCTHEIAKRLLPGLPRKGLRAVAGYFGHSVDVNRRTTPHVHATALIWLHLLPLLKDRFAIGTWESLVRWLEHHKPPRRPIRSYPLNPAFRKHLPDLPGIYRMRRSNGDVLYVGKAASLKKRVNSYFRPGARHPGHTLEMLSQARRLDVTPTATALEAAVLECEQIKMLDPPYNVALKKTGRQLAWCSRDLVRSGASAGNSGWIGPFPTPREAQSLTALGRWWSEPDRISAEIATAILNLPPSHQPPDDCAARGLALFARMHAETIGERPPLQAVATLGARLWRERLERTLISDGKPTDDQAGEKTPQDIEKNWTPEAVQRGIEHMICRAAHMLRRARWFRMLGEADLVWETGISDRPPRFVSIRNGRLTACRDCETGRYNPGAIGSAVASAWKHRQMELPEYDRLRIITTEIRRLATENRHVAVQLGPGRILESDRLKRLLEWI